MTICPGCGRELEGDFAFCPHCGAKLSATAAGREQRKTVTVLFCDVTGSTELGESTDPEALRALLARYFERMKGIVEAHGGTVEKFIGDAVMAVFGVPQVHEDDALRACRAAIEMRDALPELGVQARIGLNTGEVVTGTEERLATGDAVNVAARLEQAAQPGEVLIGESTRQLVREAVESEPLEPLEVKGKAEPVSAFTLLAVTGEPERRHESRFVGRVAELEQLRQAWRRARQEERCELVTVVGDAGVGKSRLTAEFLADIGARVVRGRCVPYGEGITYWAVVEAIKQIDALPSDAVAEAALRALLGESEHGTSAEEIAWAFRKLLEEQAPLVCCFDDIQWADETFLDLIEHVALLSAGAPVLLLCLARPELVERRPQWPVAIRLNPLPEQDVGELIPGTVGDDLREKITRAAGGNPLFLTEMVAMARETEGEVVVPPTLKALLAARLDQLETAERSVLQRGAVEGEIFHRGAVQALSGNGHVTPRLAALVRKELIRPDRPQLPAEDAFRFRHLLIRDTAYDALPKATRADLHERFAGWLEKRGKELVELDEILGYHLEQAWTYRRELGQEVDGRLAAKARERLAAAGRRAIVRGDFPAAVNLLERALNLVPAGEIDVVLEIDRIESVFSSRGPGEAHPLAADLVERAAQVADPLVELPARIEEAAFSVYGQTAEVLEAVVEEALPVLEKAGDDFGLYMAYVGRSAVLQNRALMDDKIECDERALDHARRVGLPHLQLWTLGFATAARFYGSTPVSEVLTWIGGLEASGLRHSAFRRTRAEALGMLGRVGEARAMLEEERARAAELGATIYLASVLGHAIADLELRSAGDPEAAAAAGEEACKLFEETGEPSLLSTAAGKLAQAYYELDRLDDAEAWAARAEERGASDDAITQMLWRQVRAKLAARRGEREEALRVAREALEIGGTVQLLNANAHAYFDLAEVLKLVGEDPRPALKEALSRYERKENLVMAERTRERLESLR